MDDDDLPVQAHSMVRKTSPWTEYADSLDCTETGSGWFGVRLQHSRTRKTAFFCSFTDPRGHGTMPGRQDGLPDTDQFDFVAAKFPASLRDDVQSWLEASLPLAIDHRGNLHESTWTEYNVAMGRDGSFGCLSAGNGYAEKLANGVLAHTWARDRQDELYAVIADAEVNPADLIEPGVEPFPESASLRGIDAIVGLWVQSVAGVHQRLERVAQMIGYRLLAAPPSKISASIAPTYSNSQEAHTSAHASESIDADDDELSVVVTRPTRRNVWTRRLRQRRGGSLVSISESDNDAESVSDAAASEVEAQDSSVWLARSIEHMHRAPPDVRIAMGAKLAQRQPRVLGLQQDAAWMEFHLKRLREIAVHAPAVDDATLKPAKMLKFDLARELAEQVDVAWFQRVSEWVNHRLRAKGRDEEPTVTDDVVRTTLQSALDTMFDWCTGRVAIAGGAMAQVAAAYESSAFPDVTKFADIDLCVYNNTSIADVREMLQTFMRDLVRPYWDAGSRKTAFLFENYFARSWQSHFCVLDVKMPFTFKNRAPFLTIQVNSASSSGRCVSDVLLGFDRCACAFAYDARAKRVVGLERAFDALKAKSEHADLVFGSGDAASCARTGMRDVKYAKRFQVEVALPTWAKSAVETLRDRVARELVDALTELDAVLAQAVNGVEQVAGMKARLSEDFISCVVNLPRVPQHADLSVGTWDQQQRQAGLLRSVVQGLLAVSTQLTSYASFAPEGLITTLMVRFALVDYIDMIFVPEAIKRVAYTVDNKTRGAKGCTSADVGRNNPPVPDFVSRKFKRRCNAVRDVPPFSGPVFSDVCVWLDLLPPMTQCVVNAARDLRVRIGE